MVSQKELLNAFMKYYKGKPASAKRDLMHTNKGKRLLKGPSDPRIGLYMKKNGPRTYDVSSLDTKAHAMWSSLGRDATLQRLLKSKGKRTKRTGAKRTTAGKKKKLNPYIKFIKAHKGQGYSREELVQMYHAQK